MDGEKREATMRDQNEWSSFESSRGATGQQEKQCGADEMDWYSIQTRFAIARSHYIREELSNHVFGCKSTRVIVMELMSYNSATCKSQKSL